MKGKNAKLMPFEMRIRDEENEWNVGRRWEEKCKKSQQNSM